MKKIKTALCYYGNGSRLCPFKTTDLNLKYGDKVTISSSYGNDIATFVEYDNNTKVKNEDWILSRV